MTQEGSPERGEWTAPGYAHMRELGTGASGRVVLAVHQASGTRVAVKYLAERLSADRDFTARFRDEARLLYGLADPHVVRFYEYVESPRGAAIVMELVDGVSLRRVLSESGMLSPEAALFLLKGSLLGLAAAHAAGVVHRDYKPDNVLVTAEGNSKLTDLGIAVPAGVGAQAAGTPAYMAPEQWAGGPVTPACDVYAATAVFFECLTGRRPYTATTTPAMAAAHANAPIPVEAVPEPVRPLVTHGLAKNPTWRPESATVFVAELDRFAQAGYGPGWEERGVAALAGALAGLAGVFPLALLATGAGSVGGPAVPLAAGPAASVPGAAASGGVVRQAVGWVGHHVGLTVAGAVVVGAAAVGGGLYLVDASSPEDERPRSSATPVDATPTTPASGSSPPTPSGPTPTGPTPTAATPVPTPRASSRTPGPPTNRPGRICTTYYRDGQIEKVICRAN